MIRNADGWKSQYEGKDALWIHDGNPKRPHARLTSGLHSNGFFNSRLVIPDEPLLREAASDLIDLLIQNGRGIDDIDRAVGPQTGATKLAEFISEEITKRRGRKCFWASPAKHGEGENKSMVFSDQENMVWPGERVLLCEDVLTTGGSVDLTVEAVMDRKGYVIPFALVLVNRSGLKHVSEKCIRALIDRPMPIWTPEECELCKAGSEAIPAKDPVNWARLNADY